MGRLKDVGRARTSLLPPPGPAGLPRRVLADEGIVGVGIVGVARIVRNLLRDADARRRVLAMRRTFVAHDQHMSAVGFVLRKR